MSIDRTKLRWNGYGRAAHKDEFAERDEVWSWLAARLGMPALLATPSRNLRDIALPDSTLTAVEKERLVSIAGSERVRTDAHERAFHARARNYPGLLALRSGDLPLAPAAIVYPRAADEVTAILDFAAEAGISVIPWGGGTEGADSTQARTICIDMSGMDRVLDAGHDTATFEAGIAGPALAKALQAKNRTLGHQPEVFEFSTLGGWLAQGDASASALRYGGPSDWAMEIKLATPKGLLAADNDLLKNIVVGTRGAFGVITQATIRTRPLPQAHETRGFLFRDFASGQNVMRQALEDELPLLSLSLSDAEETRFWQAFEAIGQRKRFGNLFQGLRSFDENAASLSVGFAGDARTVSAAVSHFETLAAKAGAKSLKGDGISRKIPLGYLRDALLERGTGMTTFIFETSWPELAGLHTSLRSALDTALAEKSPRPGAQGISLANIAALPRGRVRLNLVFIFPQMLGHEMEQWQALQRAVHQVAGSQDNPLGQEVRHAVKNTVDPNGVLPAIS